MAWFIFHAWASQRKPCQWEMDERTNGWTLAAMQVSDTQCLPMSPHHDSWQLWGPSETPKPDRDTWISIHRGTHPLLPLDIYRMQPILVRDHVKYSINSQRLKKLWFAAIIDGLGSSLVLGMTCELWVREQCKPHQIWLSWTKKEEKLSTSKLTNRGQTVNVLSKECTGCCLKLWVKWEVVERGSDINLHLRAAWSAWNRTWFLHSHSQGTMK